MRPEDALIAFVSSAPISVAMTDRNLRFLKVSPAWLADFGSDEAAVLGRSSYDLAPETHDKYRALHERCLAGEILHGEPERVVLPNGNHRWMTWEAAPWRDEAGEIGGILITSRDMTAQKTAEEELRRQRTFTETVLQNVPLPMVVKDGEGRVLMMNRRMETYYGVEATEHIGKTPFELLPPDMASRLAEEDREALQSGEPLILESWSDTVGLGRRLTRKIKVAVREGDDPAYLLTISEDITDRRRTEEELERTRAFLTDILDSLPEPLHVKDAEGRLVIVNRAAEQLMGRSREELLGKTATELYGAERAESLEREDKEVLASGELKVWEQTAPIMGEDDPRTVRMMKLALNDPTGRPHVLTILQDTTDERRAAAELQHTREFLQTIFDNMPVGLVVKDAADGRILMMNPAVEEIYGVDHAEGLGKTHFELFPKELAERFTAQDRDVIDTGEMRTYDEEPVLTSLGERFLRRRKMLIRNARGSDYLLSISEDVTARKLAQDALKEAVARAEAANVAKSEFLANMSHEIRTPLNGVLGLADALSHMELTSRQAEIVELIVSSGKSLTAILADVLDLAKAEAGQLQLQEQAFSLKETVGAAAFLFETVARGKGLDFKVSFEDGGPDRLYGDPLRMRQVVSNLISNAVKFTSEGEVEIRAGARLGPDGDAEVSVTVRDTGPGFSEEVRAKLFSRFEQGDGSITRRYGGTGLGLSIASALAQMMGGQISCSAVVDQGATFVFHAHLALAAQTAEPEATDPEEAAGQSPDRPLKVLLAEDHEVNQKVVQLMLAGMAELVITADGQQALDAFLGPESFDIVLMDTQMPVMDGLTAIRKMREAEAELGRPRTPIVSLTANAMAHQVTMCLEAGADVHLAKPITSDGLYAAMNRALDACAAPPSADDSQAQVA